MIILVNIWLSISLLLWLPVYIIDNYHTLEDIKHTIYFVKKFKSNEILRAIELHVLSGNFILNISTE